jgi:hypothetical protein
MRLYDGSEEAVDWLGGLDDGSEEAVAWLVDARIDAFGVRRLGGACRLLQSSRLAEEETMRKGLGCRLAWTTARRRLSLDALLVAVVVVVPTASRSLSLFSRLHERDD